MEYIVANGLNIMFLCIGIGFLLVSFRIAGLLGNANRLLTKIHRITDLVETVIQRPMQMMMAAQNIIGRILKLFF